MEKSVYPKRHEDDDYFDEVRIVVRERYKTSGMSGDEWRFHRVIQLFHKGALCYERPFNGKMQAVAGFLPWVLVDASEGGHEDFKQPKDGHQCMQPGCVDPWVSEFEIIEEFGPQGQRLHPEEQQFSSKRRRFCQRHLRRGDCSREDCDTNYRLISGPGLDAQNWSEANVVEAAQVTVRVDSAEKIGLAVEHAIRKHKAPNN